MQTLGRSHPLVGRIYSSSAGALVDRSALAAAIETSEYLVLGETHDNRDHHALEAALVSEFLDAHAAAAVGFEMLDEDVRTVVENPPRDPDAFARAVKWDASGWPEFSQYRPVFEVVLARGARIIAAHPSAEHVRASMGGIREDETKALHLDAPFEPSVREALREEIREAHCGHAPPAMLEMMERAQSYKDAFMARALRDANGPAALVTGAGHARNDRAVPRFLRLSGAKNVVSVAFRDVDDARTKPDAYDAGAFDYIVFTPRVTDEDACTRFKEELRKMQQGHATESARASVTEVPALAVVVGPEHVLRD